MANSISPTIPLAVLKDQIELYVDCWKHSSKKFIDAPEEIIQNNYFENISTDCERNFLIISKYPMHGITFEAFIKLPVFLLDTHRIQVNHDHYYYWAFVADVYEIHKSKLEHVYDHDISGRFRLLMDVLFLASHSPIFSNEKQRLERSARMLKPYLGNVQINSFILAAHLAILYLKEYLEECYPLTLKLMD